MASSFLLFLAIHLAGAILHHQIALAANPPYGQLSVKGTQLVGANGQPVSLHGMSLFWSSFPTGAPFYNKDTVQILKCKWNANVVRAAMGIDNVGGNPGYLINPSKEQAKVEAVVQAAIDLGIYVIIDWHDHNADQHLQQAVAFFSAMSKKYAPFPNIIYETFNEPLQVNWTTVVKPYHEKVVAAIRANDKKNVIVLGTTTWSQDVDVAAQNPVAGTNLMYTLHFYAATHKQSLRDKADAALKKGIGIFVTEYGTVDASGSSAPDPTSAQEWWTYLDAKQISYAAWAIEVGNNGLKVNSSTLNVPDSDLTAAAQLVKKKLATLNDGVSC